MIFLKNATFIDFQTLEFKQTHIKVFEGNDHSIEFTDILPVENDLKAFTVIDCTNKLVTKSFSCGHHHVYSALSRGMGAPKKQPTNFYEILEYIWWKLDSCLDLEMIEASALATAIACAKNGVTFAIDHHASPNAINGSLETIAKAFDRVGVAHLLCYEITDRNGISEADKGLTETESYLRNRQGLVGLHASFTVSDESMQKAADLAEKFNTGVHIHVAEDAFDQVYTKREYKKTVVQRLRDFGVLKSSKTILGHCLHLSGDERDFIKDSKAFIVQNTESNLNNNVGYFNSEWLGENIMLGTDGMHSDMLRSAKNAFFVGQGFDSIDFPTAYKRFRKVHDYLRINKFNGDGENNLVVIDYKTPTEINQSNFLGHFIFGLESSYIQHVISSGKLIVHDRKVLNVNEEEVLEFSKIQAKRLWHLMSK